MAKSQIRFKVTSTAGEAEYILEPLTRREAMHVFHASLQTLLSAVGPAVRSSGSQEEAFLSAAALLDFDKIYPVAEAVFRLATIITSEGVTEMKELADSDYFDDRPDEFYLALGKAIASNWPNFFGRVRDLFPGFGALNAAAIPKTE